MPGTDVGSMTLNELDKALQYLGWTRVDRRTWSAPPRLITLLHGRSSDPWELKTLTGVSPTTREYFPDARSIFEAVEDIQ